MRIGIVSQHLPDPDGRASDRALFALGEGLVALGHEVHAWSWRPGRPTGPVPTWCEWSPLPGEPRWRTKVRALVRPRSDIVAAGRGPWPDGDLDLADGPLSFPAIAGRPRSIIALQYRVALDVRATHRWTPADVQDLRGEQRALRRAGLLTACSARVAAGTRAVVVPIGMAMPLTALPATEAPVVACVADWTWPPNRLALDVLRAAWPLVRGRIPRASLLLAGRGLDTGSGAGGIEHLGPVTHSVDVLARAAVLAFPCPPSSGPKVKVLEAMAYGRPVVTTTWGLEGLAVAPDEGALITEADPGSFADALVELLVDPARARALGLAGRSAVLAGHAPAVAAGALTAAILDRWPEVGTS